MEILFRSLMLRPPQSRDIVKQAVVLRPDPAVASQIEAALKDSRAAERLRLLSEGLLASPRAVQRVDALRYGQKLLDFAKKIQDTGATIGAAKAIVKAIFGIEAEEVDKLADFVDDRTRLANTLAALKFIGRLTGDVQSLSTAYLAATLIGDLARGAMPDPATSLAEYFSRTLVLPDIPGLPRFVARSFAAEAERPAAPPQDETEKKRAALRKRTQDLESALTDLLALPPRFLNAGAAPEKEAAPQARVVKRSAAPRTRKTRGGTAEKVPMNSLPAVASGTATLTLSAEAEKALAPRTVNTFKELGLSLKGLSPVTAANRLIAALHEVGAELFELEVGQAPRTTVARIGSGLYQLREGASLLPRGEGAGLMPLVPMTHGAVRPVGIGDLLVVKQQLKGYEAQDLAHIENVLRGEHKSREHRRALTTEETTTVEEEITKEEERDQQSTERFEMQREASSVQKEDQSLHVGVSLSASYGGLVEFKASTDFAMNRAKEESTKVASTYSKEVTNRAVSKVTERVRKETVRKVTETYEETNVHEIDNKGATDHVIGQYQWINKVYEAQVFNYGKRLMFDIIVPEPAAFFLHSKVAAAPKPGIGLSKPIPFTLSADQISVGNYSYYVQLYDAQGVEAPPVPTVTVSKAFDGTDDRSDSGSMVRSAELPIPGGYAAFKGFASTQFTKWEDTVTIDLSVGKNIHRFVDDANKSWSFNLANEVQSVAIGLSTFRINTFYLTVEITCNLLPREMESWRIKTHAAIKQGYLKQLRDYEEKLAAATAEAAEQVQGRNPLDNELTERAELKKASISIITAQRFDLFGSIFEGPSPEINFEEAEAQGRYIRFFEQAFEWEQMMYFYYPYYWGRKSRWLTTSLVQDNDPRFAAFLQAGAARVVFSVRPGFERAVAHFLETGQIWQGGDPPLITSPLYLSIIDEIRERDGAPGTEVAQGEPWDVRVPTSLVLLRQRDTLPTWKKDQNGRWVPDT